MAQVQSFSQIVMMVLIYSELVFDYHVLSIILPYPLGPFYMQVGFNP